MGVYAGLCDGLGWFTCTTNVGEAKAEGKNTKVHCSQKGKV